MKKFQFGLMGADLNNTINAKYARELRYNLLSTSW